MVKSILCSRISFGQKTIEPSCCLLKNNGRTFKDTGNQLVVNIGNENTPQQSMSGS